MKSQEISLWKLQNEGYGATSLLPRCQDADGIWLHQKQYILSMLQKFGLMDAKPVSTPADHNVRLVKDDNISRKLEDKATYQSMVGSLLYAAMATRPDIAQALKILCSTH